MIYEDIIADLGYVQYMQKYIYVNRKCKTISTAGCCSRYLHQTNTKNKFDMKIAHVNYAS